ncbi:MAG: hypothetical protein RBR08_16540 [Desulforegulaceae bacterium]|nr:hypothetical protein [Desulforegulaceae bacterium]
MADLNKKTIPSQEEIEIYTKIGKLLFKRKFNESLKKIEAQGLDSYSNNYINTWNTIWLIASEANIYHFLYYLKHEGVDDQTLSLAFQNTNETAFIIFSSVLSEKKKNLFKNSVNSNKNQDIAESRKKISNLFIEFKGSSIYGIDTIYYLPKSIAGKQLPFFTEKQLKPFTFKFDQWSASLCENLNLLTIIRKELVTKNFGLGKAMNFPHAPFLSYCINHLLDFEDPKTYEKDIKKYAEITLENAKLKLGFIRSGISGILNFLRIKPERLFEKLSKYLEKNSNKYELKNINIQKITKEIDKLTNNRKEKYPPIMDKKKLWDLSFEELMELILYLNIKINKYGPLWLSELKDDEINGDIQSTYYTAIPEKLINKKSYELLLKSIDEDIIDTEKDFFFFDYQKKRFLNELEDKLDITCFIFNSLIEKQSLDTKRGSNKASDIIEKIKLMNDPEYSRLIFKMGHLENRSSYIFL